jgi:hypothetical protein
LPYLVERLAAVQQCLAEQFAAHRRIERREIRG